MFLVLDQENVLQHPRSYRLCQHMSPQPECGKNLTPSLPCPSSDEIKYRMTRVAVDSLEVFLVEDGSALNLQVLKTRLNNKSVVGCLENALVFFL